MPSSIPQRKRHNVSQACINCRQRKKKCDGTQPVCGTCESYNDECIWTARTDWRKAVSRTEANALRSRVAELERMLRGRSGSTSGVGDDGDVGDASMGEYSFDMSASGSMSAPTATVPLPAAPAQPPPMSMPLNIPAMSSTSVPPALFSQAMPTQPMPQPILQQPQPLPAQPQAQPLSSSAPLASTSTLPTPGQDGTPDTDPLGEDIDGLMIQDSSGRLRMHAPHSAFRHDSAVEPTAATTASPVQRLQSTGDHWARYLPDTYLTREQHDVAVDRFFRYFACWAQRATPHVFYRDMGIAVWTEHESELPVVAPNYSPLLHNYILAIGLAFSDEEHLRALCTRKLFAAEGTKHLDRECASPCVATVQGLAIRSSFASTMGDYSLGWVNMGLANRLCYALGLHVNTAPLVRRGKLNSESATQRNVTFWTCYCQEGLWAIYIGRKPMMQDYSLPLPTTDGATDETLWEWPPGPRAGQPPQRSYLSLSFVYTARLMQIATEIIRTINSGRADKVSLVESGTVQRFSDSLDGWLDSLPPQLAVEATASKGVLPHVLMVHLSWAWIVIFLFQPFSQVVTRQRDRIDGAYRHIGTQAMTRCHQAALKIVHLSSIWQTQHSLRFTPPTLTAIIYCSGTSFLLAAAQASLPSQTAAALQKVHTCLGFLEEIGQTWAAGRQQAAILQELLSECARASLELPAFMGDIGRGWSNAEDARVGAQAGTPDQAMDSTSFHPTSWSGDDSFEEFIQSLLSQSTVPIAAQTDLLGLNAGFGLDGFL